MLEVGSIVGGKFRIEHILGRGGMGIVAVATHLQLEQQVALKVLHDPMVEDPEVRERFLREARASARLRSEHVCRVSDVGQLDDGAPFIVMELLEGRDLQATIADGPLPIASAVDYVLQACVGVAEAHAIGIVHRDLKPANLFLTTRVDGTPLIKVLDFGIAKAAAAVGDFKITRTSTLMGSPGYMSPEQLRSAHDVDARSDIWSLGVILYELVSQRLPFHGASITELAVKVVMDPPEPLAIDAPAFAAIVYRCLEKAADQRYASVAALAADLAPLGGEGARRSATSIAALGAPRSTRGSTAGGSAISGHSATLPLGAAPMASGHSTTVSTSAAPVVSGHGTTLQTAASQSTGESIALVPPRPRRGLVLGGVALATLAALTSAVLVSRCDQRPATPAHRASAVRLASDAGAPSDSGADSAVAATATSVPELRSKLRALADRHDWDAVIQLADLDRDDPEIAAVVADAKQQYVAQQARAIDVQVKQGQCARAKELAAAAHQVVADDTTLEPRAHACKPYAAPTPSPAAMLDEATQAFERKDLAKALDLAERVVRADPGNPAALRVAALSACSLKNVDKAERYAGKLRGSDRSAARSVCRSNNIDLDAGDDAEPEDPELAEAQSAAKLGDWDTALSLAEAALQRSPRSPPALTVALTAACHLKRDRTARILLRKLPITRQRALRQLCIDQGVRI